MPVAIEYPIMADPAIIAIVRQYLRNLAEEGIVARMGVLFGSYALGHPNEWSGIDLVVVSAAFDGTFSRNLIDSLWHAEDGRIMTRTRSSSTTISGIHLQRNSHQFPLAALDPYKDCIYIGGSL
jgi:hypothetical protein